MYLRLSCNPQANASEFQWSRRSMLPKYRLQILLLECSLRRSCLILLPSLKARIGEGLIWSYSTVSESSSVFCSWIVLRCGGRDTWSGLRSRSREDNVLSESSPSKRSNSTQTRLPDFFYFLTITPEFK